MRDVLVRAQELGGRWVSLGADAARGIVVENLSADVDTWGPRACSFVLRRRTDVPWPDIGALAPIEILDQGVLVWSGRVRGTPTSDGSDRSITVNGEGWQFHLDDDVYRKTYVHSSLTDFVDSRSLLGAPLGNFATAGTVTTGEGAITLGMPVGTYPASFFVGVTLDMGTAQAKSAAVNWLSSANTPDVTFTCRGSDLADGGLADPSGGSSDNAFSFAVNTASAAFNTGTFATARRYVTLFLFWASGGATGAEIWVKIIPPTAFFSSTSYVSSGVSILKASDVVLDAKTQGTLLLSSDTSKVQTTSFSIPDFAMSAPSTPRDAINAANAYHAWQPRVRAEQILEYRPLPAAPVIQVDQRSAFDEASSGDSTEIYSGVLVNYTDAAGQAQSLSRGQPATVYTVSTIQPTNPSATTNTTGWTVTSTLTRDTTAGNWTTSPAGFNLTVPSSGAYAYTSSWTGALSVGKTYALSIDALYATTGGLGVTLEVWVDNVNVASAALAATGVFATGTATWVQPSTSAPVIIVRASPFATPPLVFVSTTVLFDNLNLYESAATVVNRRGFKRTKVLDTNMALTSAGAQQIGDVYLPNHKTTPLKGQLTVTGYGTAKNATNGQSLSTAELLLNGGELVRLMHLIDPDTGALAREGRIASVSWDATSDTSTIEIDSQSSNFEAMLSRLALVTGQVT